MHKLWRTCCLLSKDDESVDACIGFALSSGCYRTVFHARCTVSHVSDTSIMRERDCFSMTLAGLISPAIIHIHVAAELIFTALNLYHPYTHPPPHLSLPWLTHAPGSRRGSLTWVFHLKWDIFDSLSAWWSADQNNFQLRMNVRHYFPPRRDIPSALFEIFPENNAPPFFS